MKSVAVCLISLLASASTASAEAPIVSGQVRLVDGSAVAGASVVLFDVERLGVVAKATTDESGQFALVLRGLRQAQTPVGFALGQSYPNPFNPATIIPYELAATAPVRLEVFNVLGQRVVTLVDAEQAAGHYAVEWDGRDASGQGVAAGVYIYRLTVASTRLAAGAMATGRMVLVDGAGGSAVVGGLAAGTLDAPDAPAGSAVEVPVYGLAVYGAGIATFVDSAFVGSGPVEVVVESSGVGQGKAVAEQQEGPGLIQWSLEDVDLLDPAGLEYVAQAVNEQIKQVCPSASSEIGFAHQNDFLVCEMSIPAYECLSGLDTDAHEALGEGSITLLTDVILGLTALAITALGTTLAPVLVAALTVYSTVGDIEFVTDYGSTAAEKVFRRSTRVGLLGDFISDGKIGPGRSYTPVLMVKHESADEVRTVDLRLHTTYSYARRAECISVSAGICNFERESNTVDLGQIDVNPEKGYFVIPAKTVSFEAIDKLRRSVPRRGDEWVYLKDREFSLSMNTGQWFWDGGTTFKIAEFVPQFTFAEGSSSFGDLVFLDAGASVLPADGVAAYEWFYNNRRIGAGSTLIVRQSSFAELVDGQGSVRIQLQVTVGRSVETATQVVQLGESEAEEPIEPEGPEVPGELVTGTERSFSLPGGGEMEFVWIEPGVFQMGSPESEEGYNWIEGPVHEVEISQGFYMGQYEVTQGQWASVMGETPWSGRDYVQEHPSHPAVHISWYDVREFIDKLNDAAGSDVYRLASEAEWSMRVGRARRLVGPSGTMRANWGIMRGMLVMLGMWVSSMLMRWVRSCRILGVCMICMVMFMSGCRIRMTANIIRVRLVLTPRGHHTAVGASSGVAPSPHMPGVCGRRVATAICLLLPTTTTTLAHAL